MFTTIPNWPELKNQYYFGFSRNKAGFKSYREILGLDQDDPILWQPQFESEIWNLF
jgi:hypothetical protein